MIHEITESIFVREKLSVYTVKLAVNGTAFQMLGHKKENK